MHFAGLPPEVNSGRMYAGPGAGPMLTAASAWEELANELHSSVEDFESVISELTGDPWQGPAAASAYESAYSMTVPPSEVAANRAQLMTLQATNQSGLATQSAAVGQAAGTSAGSAQSAMSAVPSALQSLESSTGLTGFEDFSNVYDLAELGTGLIGNGTGLIGLSGAAGFITKAEDKITGDVLGPDGEPSPGGPKPQGSPPPSRGFSAAKGATAVSAEMGDSGSLGRLSVPQGWASSAPQVRLAALETPMANAAPASAPGMFSDTPLMGQAPLMGMPGRDTARGPQTPAGSELSSRHRRASRMIERPALRLRCVKSPTCSANSPVCGIAAH